MSDSTTGRGAAQALHPAGRFHCSAFEAGGAPVVAAPPARRAVFWSILGLCAALHAAAFVLVMTARPTPEPAEALRPIELVGAPPARQPRLAAIAKPRHARRTPSPERANSPPGAKPAPDSEGGRRRSASRERPEQAAKRPGGPATPGVAADLGENARFARAARPSTKAAAVPRAPQIQAARVPAAPRAAAPVRDNRGDARRIDAQASLARIASAESPLAQLRKQDAERAAAAARRAQAKARHARIARAEAALAQLRSLEAKRAAAAARRRAAAAAREKEQRQAQRKRSAAQADRRDRARAAALVSAYRAAVSRRLLSHETYPASALARGARGAASVRFEIGPTGALLTARIAKSSGDAGLDAAALAAVRRSAPFGAPPPGAPQIFVAPILFGVR